MGRFWKHVEVPNTVLVEVVYSSRTSRRLILIRRVISSLFATVVATWIDTFTKTTLKKRIRTALLLYRTTTTAATTTTTVPIVD